MSSSIILARGSVLLKPSTIKAIWLGSAKAMYSGGAGVNVANDKSSGVAGSIRSAGGAFAERESALENAYFHKVEYEQLARLRDHLQAEIEHHENAIIRHMEAIGRHKNHVIDIEDGLNAMAERED